MKRPRATIGYPWRDVSDVDRLRWECKLRLPDHAYDTAGGYHLGVISPVRTARTWAAQERQTASQRGEEERLNGERRRADRAAVALGGRVEPVYPQGKFKAVGYRVVLDIDSAERAAGTIQQG